MIDKNVLTRTFSRIAGRYDAYAGIQNRVAGILGSAITRRSVRSILEVGCGTGNFTAYLRERFPAARLVAVDIAGGMVELARAKAGTRGVEFRIADAEAICFRERFDLIASNAAFQWFSDLPGAVDCFRSLLQPRGGLYFSTFGPRTFYQLRESLRLFDGKRHVAAEQFLDKTAVKKILQGRFGESAVEEKRLTVTFGTLRELFAHIQYTSGVRNGVKKIWTPRAFESLEEIYRKKFKRIDATYQVFICRAQ